MKWSLYFDSDHYIFIIKIGLAQMSLHLILLLFFFSILGVSQPGKFNLTANQRYSYVGKTVIDCSSLLPVSSYEVTFPDSLRSSSTQAYVVWGGLDLSLATNNFSLFVNCSSLTSSSMRIGVTSFTSSLVSRLSLNYLLLRWEDSFQDDFSSNFYITELHQTVSINSSTQIYFANNQSIDGGYKQFRMLNGLSMASIDSGDLSLQHFWLTLQATMVLGSLLSVSISTKLQIFEISLVQGYYQQQTGGQLNIKNGSFYATSPGQIQYLNSEQATPFNTIVGLTGITIMNATTQLSFGLEVNTNQIIATSLGSSHSIMVSYFIVYSRYCDYITPMYDGDTQTCLSDCPFGYVSDATNLKCTRVINGTAFAISLTVSLLIFLFICYIVRRHINLLNGNNKIREEKDGIKSVNAVKNQFRQEISIDQEME